MVVHLGKAKILEWHMPHLANGLVDIAAPVADIFEELTKLGFVHGLAFVGK